MRFSGGGIIAYNPTCNSVKSIFEDSTTDFCNDLLKSILESETIGNSLFADEEKVEESTPNVPSSFETVQVVPSSTKNSLFADEEVVEKSSTEIQNQPSSSKTVLVVSSSTEKSKKEGPEFLDTRGEILDTRGIFKDFSVPAPAFFKIDWEENTSDLVKKTNSKNKKHTNDLTVLEDEKKERTFQKRRVQKPSLFQTEERFDDKLPYICFECKKTFAFYSSLLEHEKSHALNKIWHG